MAHFLCSGSHERNAVQGGEEGVTVVNQGVC